MTSCSSAVVCSLLAFLPAATTAAPARSSESARVRTTCVTNTTQQHTPAAAAATRTSLCRSSAGSRGPQQHISHPAQRQHRARTAPRRRSGAATRTGPAWARARAVCGRRWHEEAHRWPCTASRLHRCRPAQTRHQPGCLRSSRRILQHTGAAAQLRSTPWRNKSERIRKVLTSQMTLICLSNSDCCAALSESVIRNMTERPSASQKTEEKIAERRTREIRR